jgi:hypothetical protein
MSWFSLGVKCQGVVAVVGGMGNGPRLGHGHGRRRSRSSSSLTKLSIKGKRVVEGQG